MTKENLVKAPATRTRRNPVEGRNKLKLVGADPNYVYRVINDLDDRINYMLDIGYEFALEDGLRIGDSAIDNHSKLGKVRMINVGGGIKAVLMKIKKEFYDEDQEAKLEHIRKIEAAMKPNPDGQYGEIKLKRN